MRTCADCGKTLPMENRRGPRRKRCTDCSPSRPRKTEKPRVPASKPVIVAGSCVESTRAMLDETKQGGTPLSFALLAMAERIDSGEEVGAALASLVKQYQATLAAVAPKAKAEADPLQKLLAGESDELAVRRERRSG